MLNSDRIQGSSRRFIHKRAVAIYLWITLLLALCIIMGRVRLVAEPAPLPPPAPGAETSNPAPSTVVPPEEPAIRHFYGPFAGLIDRSADITRPLEFPGKLAAGQPRRIIRLILSQWLTNCYILVGRTNKAIVIDPTDWMVSLPDNHWDLTGKDTTTLVETLRKYKIEPRMIVSTHGHLDHVSGDAVLKTLYQCTICMGDADVDADGRPKDSHYFPGGLPRVDRRLKEGDTIECDGIKLKVLQTPGHSPGSISMVCGNWVFTGDTLFWGTVGRTNFMDGSGNWPLEIESIRTKLYQLPSATLVLPGHFQFTTIGEEKANNPWTKDSAPAPG